MMKTYNLLALVVVILVGCFTLWRDYFQILFTPTATSVPTTSDEDQHRDQQYTAAAADDGDNPRSRNNDFVGDAPLNDMPWANLSDSTIGYYPMTLRAGYRNQMMKLSAFVMEAGTSGCGGSGCGQILHATISHQDIGSGRRPLAYWFDILHWNSYYPQLPRMVSCDQNQITDYDCDTKSWRDRGSKKDQFRHPYAAAHRGSAYFIMYKDYTKGQGPFATPQFPNPIDLLMIRGAIRPHPDLMEIVNHIKDNLLGGSSMMEPDGSNASRLISLLRQRQQHKLRQQVPYMALHARVEPDMQRHTPCQDSKVIQLRDIVDDIYTKWPSGPPFGIQHVFIAINRKYLESEGHPSIRVNPHPSHHPDPNAHPTNSTVNWIAVENLQFLNHLVTEGMWNGTVPVHEFGGSAVVGTRFQDVPGIAGSMINYELATDAAVFVGTEVSSWSDAVINTRFYRDAASNNYGYRPDGIHQWTSPNETIHPPPFRC